MQSEGSTSGGNQPIKIKSELKSQDHTSNIHSLCWEDTEFQEGLSAKELVSADSS
jgi:hypothetical protein